MNDSISATHEYLLARYGPLLTLKHLAEVMHSSTNGLRIAISRQREPIAVGLASARRRFGRRTYFEARRIAAVIDQDESPFAPGTLLNTSESLRGTCNWPGPKHQLGASKSTKV